MYAYVTTYSPQGTQVRLIQNPRAIKGEKKLTYGYTNPSYPLS